MGSGQESQGRNRHERSGEHGMSRAGLGSLNSAFQEALLFRSHFCNGPLDFIHLLLANAGSDELLCGTKPSLFLQMDARFQALQPILNDRVQEGQTALLARVAGGEILQMAEIDFHRSQ